MNDFTYAIIQATTLKFQRNKVLGTIKSKQM